MIPLISYQGGGYNDHVCLSFYLSVCSLTQQVMHKFIWNFLPKVGFDQLSRWLRFGDDPVDLHCQLESTVAQRGDFDMQPIVAQKRKIYGQNY